MSVFTLKQSLGYPALSLLAMACLLAWPLSGQTQQPPEMVEMARVFRVHARDLSSRYNETIKALPAQYANDIKTLHDRYQQNGDLDGVLATAREQKRYQEAMAAERDPFELTPEMPPEAIVAKPQELRQLQEQYVSRFKDAATVRTRDIKELAGKYVKSLQKVQSELTRAGRIDEAVVIKAESECLQQGMEDGSMMQLVEKMATELPKTASGSSVDATAEVAKPGEVPVYGVVPNWAKWKFVSSNRFSRERTQYDHPDVPDELKVMYSEKTGRGNFSGRCLVNSVQIGEMMCRWFGKALVWRVDDVSTLTTTFVLTSRHISAGEEHGPAVQLAVLSNGQPLRKINVNLQETETTLRLVKDTNSNRCALMWPRGSLTETFELPEGGAISVLLGVTVRNPGEICDTSFIMQ